MALTQISTAGVKDDAVTSGKIPANAVGSSELADNAVDTAAIADNAVTGAKIADNLDLPDNNKIRVGTGNDLQIYHDSSNGNSHINESGSGSLVIKATNTIINSSTDEAMIAANADGAVELYHNNSKKFETASHGVSIAGNLDFPDNTSGNASLRFGNSQDFFMNHNGSDSYIINNTGDLYIRDLNGDVHIQGKDNEESIIAKADGAVELYHDNVKTAETVANGFQITAIENNHASLYLWADEGDNDADKWQIMATTQGQLRIYNKASGSNENTIVLDGNGAVELYHDNSKKFETTSVGFTAGTLSTSSAGAYMTISDSSSYGLIIDQSASKNITIRTDGPSINLNQKTNGEYYIRCLKDAAVELYHNGTKQCETSANGLAFPSGKGIDFSATSDATGKTSELLDDYEEGTWDPTFGRDNGGYSSLNTSVDTLRYTKVGELVTISGRVCVGTSNSGANGHIKITLPFTAKGGGTDQSDYAHIMVNTHGVNVEDDCLTMMAEIAGGASTMNLHQIRDNANWLAFNSSSLQHNNNEYFAFVGSYRAA